MNTMEVQAHLRNLRISPRKVRLIVNVIRGMNVQSAKVQLEFINKKSAQPISKLLNSAIANARNNFSLNENNLYVSKIFVNEGATLKRWIPRAMGRASDINKRTSHITIVLDEFKDKAAEGGKKDDLNKKIKHTGKAGKEEKEKSGKTKISGSRKTQISSNNSDNENNINKD